MFIKLTIFCCWPICNLLLVLIGREFGDTETLVSSQQDQQKKTDMVWACGEKAIRQKLYIVTCTWMDKGVEEDKVIKDMDGKRETTHCRKTGKDMDLRMALDDFRDRGRWIHLVNTSSSA